MSNAKDGDIHDPLRPHWTRASQMRRASDTGRVDDTGFDGDFVEGQEVLVIIAMHVDVDVAGSRDPTLGNPVAGIGLPAEHDRGVGFVEFGKVFDAFEALFVNGGEMLSARWRILFQTSYSCLANGAGPVNINKEK